MPTQTEGSAADARLTDIWTRLEAVCRRLWEEDKGAAVPLQALVEEFRGESVRVERELAAQRKALSEARETLQREFQSEHRAEMGRAEQEIAHCKRRCEALEASDLEARRQAEELAHKLEAAQIEGLRQREEFLKGEAEKEAQRAQRMQAFYDDMKKKTELLEQTWEQRRRDLETDFTRRSEELAGKHQQHLSALRERALGVEQALAGKETELAGRETRCVQWESALKRQEELVAARRKELEEDYGAKRAELDLLKERFQREIASLVKEYGGKKA